MLVKGATGHQADSRICDSISLYPDAFHVLSSLCKHVLAESQSDNLALLSGHMLEVPILYSCMPYLPVSRGRSIKPSEFSSFPGLLPKFSRLILLSALEVLPPFSMMSHSINLFNLLFKSSAPLEMYAIPSLLSPMWFSGYFILKLIFNGLRQ